MAKRRKNNPRLKKKAGSSKKKKRRKQQPLTFAERFKRTTMTFVRLVAVLAVICLVAFIGRAFYYFLLESEYFRVEEVVIDTEDAETTHEISELVGAEFLKDQNIFRVSTESLKNLLETEMPKLADVQVKKVYPSTLKISARVREPLVYVSAKNIYLIDKEGMVIEKIGRAETDLPDLPFISGLESSKVQRGRKITDDLLATSLEVLIILKKVKPRICSKISEINANEEQGLTVVMLDGTKLYFHSDDIRCQLAALETFLQRIEGMNNLLYADFRFEDQIVYKPATSPAAMD